LSGKEQHKDGAATANARFAGCLYVLGIMKLICTKYSTEEAINTLN